MFGRNVRYSPSYTRFNSSEKNRLSSGTWDALIAIRSEAGDAVPVFVSRTGDPLSRTQAFRIVRAAAKRVGVDKG